jgi:hypothetical protein
MHLVTQSLLLPLHGSVCVLAEEAGKQRGGCWKGSVTNYLYLFVTLEQVYFVLS